jgi:phosphoglycolate phosphatase
VLGARISSAREAICHTDCARSRHPRSDQAVRSYLALHGLDHDVRIIAARRSPDPALLKPSPYLVQQAITELGAPLAQCVLVGDSTTDPQAAALAGIDSIGYANKPGKLETLAAAGATTVVTSLADLVPPLRAQPPLNSRGGADG